MTRSNGGRLPDAPGKDLRADHASSVLFIGHDAFRAGAQIELLHVLRWLRRNTGLRLSLLLKGGGDLLPDYQGVLETRLLSPPRSLRSLARRAREYVQARLRPPTLASRLRDTLGELRVDLIYANSVASLDLVPALRELSQSPVVCHVHELEASIRRYCGLDTFRRADSHVSAYIAASAAVEDNLVKNHSIAPERIHRIYEAVPAPNGSRADLATRSGTRRSLGIPEDAVVVGGCGTMDWRKAPDIFLQIARRVTIRSAATPIHFVWVGGRLGSDEHFSLLYDAERFGVQPFVHFVGPQANPAAFFATFDMFLLSSREDPFPLVCLEAAALGLPILCFAQSGGMPELVEDDAGHVLPYLDVDAAADHLLALASSPARRARLGQRAAQKFRERFDIEVTGPQFLEVMQACGAKATGKARLA